jgi:decaprenyl-phosphate phosphoribosyltransferase
MRPRQWLKNSLVAAAPLAAGELLARSVLLPTLGAFAAFCLASSATYLVNDVRDVEVDRAHPQKRHRPIAAGQLGARTAVVAAVVLALGALALGVWVRPALGVSVAAYLLVTLAYSLRYKHEPVIELALLTAGFLLRATAGGAATGIPLSNWFLIVTGFGSLFIAAGKRFSELVSVEAGARRRSLTGYTPEYLRFVWGMAASITVLGYCLWAFEVASGQHTTYSWTAMSVAPFVLAVMRYAVDIDAGHAEAPEDVVLSDPQLLVLGACWLALFTLGAIGV